MSKRILLGRSNKSIYTTVDDDVFERLNGKSCRLHKSGYVTVRFRQGPKRKEYYIHRWLLDAPTDLTVDHINFDKLDNRRENLQLMTRIENSRKQPPNKTSNKGKKYKKHLKMYKVNR